MMVHQAISCCNTTFFTFINTVVDDATEKVMEEDDLVRFWISYSAAI